MTRACRMYWRDTERFMKEFSRNYLAPSVRARPVRAEDIEECRRFSRRMIRWAAGVVGD